MIGWSFLALTCNICSVKQRQHASLQMNSRQAMISSLLILERQRAARIDCDIATLTFCFYIMISLVVPVPSEASTTPAESGSHADHSTSRQHILLSLQVKLGCRHMLQQSCHGIHKVCKLLCKLLHQELEVIPTHLRHMTSTSTHFTMVQTVTGHTAHAMAAPQAEQGWYNLR